MSFKGWKIWFLDLRCPALAFIVAWTPAWKSLYIMVDLVLVGFTGNICFTKKKPRIYEVSRVKGD